MTDSSTDLRAVIDGSFAARLILPGPTQADFQGAARDLARREVEIVAPTLWEYEVISALTKAIYFGQVMASEAQPYLAEILEFPIRLIPPDDEQNRLAFDWTLRLKRVAAYDSYYLALAQTLRCDLWTADRRLFNAASVSWVRLVESNP
jgi:predicted nucleic acid-binding protein